MDWHSFEAFLKTIEGRPYGDVILMADSAATDAERRRLRRHKSPDDGDSAGYANQLKAFICFMRYGVKPKGLSLEQINRIQCLRGRSLIKTPERSRKSNDISFPVTTTWRCS